MSSILRALKKLENETTARQARAGWPRSPRYSYSGSKKTSAGLMLTLLAVLILAAGLTGGWWYFTDRPAPDESFTPQTAVPTAPDRQEALTPAPDTAEEQVKRQPVLLPTEPVSEPTLDLVAAEPVTPEVYDEPRLKTASEQSPSVHEAAELLPVLDDPGLSLQAIAWAETPDKRVAVIGNRVTREGGMVAGFIVERINPDDIIVRQKGVRWRILFKNR